MIFGKYQLQYMYFDLGPGYTTPTGHFYYIFDKYSMYKIFYVWLKLAHTNFESIT